MFLSNEPNNIEDFLKAVKFISPEGMNLKYFIVPVGQNTPAFGITARNAGFTPDKPDNTVQIVPGVNDTIVYKKKDLSNIQSVSSDVVDVFEKPEPMPITRRVVTTTIQTQPAQGSAIPSTNPKSITTGPLSTELLAVSRPTNIPSVKVIESTERYCDLMLKEDVKMLPRGSLYHFVKD